MHIYIYIYMYLYTHMHIQAYPEFVVEYRTSDRRIRKGGGEANKWATVTHAPLPPRAAPRRDYSIV